MSSKLHFFIFIIKKFYDVVSGAPDLCRLNWT